MADDEPGYLSYLLRLWQTYSDGQLVWRASLESPHTGERQGFADLEQLFVFLAEQTNGQPQRLSKQEEGSQQALAQAPVPSEVIAKG